MAYFGSKQTMLIGIGGGGVPSDNNATITRHSFTVNQDDETAFLLETSGAFSVGGGWRSHGAGAYTVWRYPIEDASKVTSALWHAHTAGYTLLQVSLDNENWVTVFDNGAAQVGYQRYRELTDYVDIAKSGAKYLYVKIGLSDTGVIKYTVRGAWKWNDTLSGTCPEQTVNFVCNGRDCVKLDGTYKLRYFYAEGTASTPYSTGEFSNEIYRSIDFGDTEQEISKDFYDYLLANAVSDGGTATKGSVGYSYILNDIPVTLDITYGDANGALLPSVTEGDNGKFMRVVDGQWRAVTGGEYVNSRVYTVLFKVGETSETKYIYETDGHDILSSFNGTYRFMDMARYIVYKYHLPNSALIRKLYWTAILDAKVLLEVSDDGENWTTLLDQGTEQLNDAKTTFELTDKVNLLRFDDIYIRLSNSDPDKTTGFGGAIKNTGNVELRIERYELPFGF